MGNTEEERISTGLRLVIKDGLASQVMLSLTAGPFLVAFALMLGASSGHIGMLAAIPFLTQLIQIPRLSDREATFETRHLRIRILHQ